MSGLSDLKVKIKNQPHNLAWINAKERSVLKAMGGSGKAGPMGIPAYDWKDGDPDEGYDPGEYPGPDDPDEGYDPGGWSPDDPDEGYEPDDSLPDLGPNEGFGFPDEPLGPPDDPMGLLSPGDLAERRGRNLAATALQAVIDTGVGPSGSFTGKTHQDAFKSADDARGSEIDALEKKERTAGLTDSEWDKLQSLYEQREKTDYERRATEATLGHRLAGKNTSISYPEYDPFIDGPRQPGGPTRTYEGPDAGKAFMSDASKGLKSIAEAGVDMVKGLGGAWANLGPTGLLMNILGIHPFDSKMGKAIGVAGRGMLSDLSKDLGKSVEDTATAVANFFGISKKDITEDHIESFHNNIGLAGGGQVYNNFIAQRRHGGRVDQHGTTWYAGPPAHGSEEPEEDKSPSAMKLYLEKLGQPSKYTAPAVPMDVPSMAPPPASSDPFELAEYRKGLARETMGNYLPFDVGGASSALNTFNEDYYGGASQLSPYNIAQMGSLLGLPAGSQEGIIGMLGGVRNEPPPPPEPEPEPEPHYEPPYDEWWFEGRWDEAGSEDNEGKHGGGIGHILQRQAGGPAQSPPTSEMYERWSPKQRADWDRYGEFGDPRRPGFTPLGRDTPIGPDGKISYLPWPEPPWPPRPEPSYPPEPPIAEPPPPTYDPVREEAARKRARELQAFKIGELDETPQTTAERLALEESGGMYKDEHGEIRDASGAVQEDWGFDYTPPPELDKKYDPPNTPDTPPPVDPTDPTQPIDPYPLPPDVIDPIPPPFDPDRPVWGRPVPPADHPTYLQPFNPDPGWQNLPPWSQPNPYVGIGSLNHPLGSPGEPYLPMMNYGGGRNIGPQQLPTGLQGLQQGMGGPQQGMLGQGLQGFGMQSPRPFGTPAFSSGFGGFGQQQGYNR